MVRLGGEGLKHCTEVAVWIVRMIPSGELDGAIHGHRCPRQLGMP